jgi:hypothetical protein
MTGTSELPRKARVVRCGVCQAALAQKEGEAATARSIHSETRADQAA